MKPHTDLSIRKPRLPLFAYGTLKTKIPFGRPRNKKEPQSQNIATNESILSGLIEGVLEAYIDGYHLRDAGGYPIAYPEISSRIYGQLLWLDLQRYDTILAMLDSYEGPSFQRVAKNAVSQKDHCPINCWIYICNERYLEHTGKNLPVITSGIWNKPQS